MSGTMSKRQQARNEKVLHELAQAPGNNVCADCSARNPSWASWSLGIFLCMRCATIHRKLGTHISKVKSLSMDSWSNEQVENMKKVGNIASNKSYNPDNKKPPIPGDADDVDPAMERFIRQKYMQRSLAGAKKHNTGSTSSDETPPPLPPKTGSRFGLRSASSIFPLGSKKKHDTGRSASPGPRSPASPRTNGGFGATVRFESNDADETEIKLQKLRDMGFRDEQRNAMVLKGVGGNLEKTIEALVRLGEGSEARTPLNLNKKQTPTASSQSLAPSTSSQDAARGRPISPASTNPFDMLDQAPLPPQPLSSQSTGTLQNRNPYNMTTTNPFGVPQQSAPQQQQPQQQQQQAMSAFDQAFQNLSLAPSQPLFPHHTGGMIAPQQQQNLPAGYQQPQMTGPAQQNYPSIALASSQAFPLTSQATGYNPFFNNQQQQQQQQPQTQFQPQQPMTINTTGYAGSYANNPFAKSPTRLQSPTLTQIPEQSQQNFYAGGQAQAPAAMPLGMQQTGNNPFFNQAMGGMPQQQQQQQQQQAPQQYGLAAQMTGQVPQYQTQGQAQGQMQMQNPQGSQMPQMPQMPQMQQGGYAPQQQYQPQQQQQQYQPQQQYQQQFQPQRPDKASILALYNYPQLAPQPPQAQQQNPAQAQGQQPPAQAGQANGAYAQQGQPQQQQQQQQQQMQQPQNQGAGSQMAGSKNPFMSAGGPAQGQQQNVAAPKAYNASRESVMALGMDWTNGRHSPDAFASLSARH